MPFSRSPAPPFWWWSKSPDAGSERPPTSTRASAAAWAAASRVRTISSGPSARPSTATARTSSAWKFPGWVATRIAPRLEALAHPGLPLRLRPRGGGRTLVAVEEALHERRAGLAEDRDGGDARRRLREPQVQVAPPAPGERALDHAGQPRRAVAVRLDPGSLGGVGAPEPRGQRRPPLADRPGRGPEGLEAPAAGLAEVGQVQAQRLQRGGHRLAEALELGVPVVAAAEAAGDHAHRAGAAVPRLDDPFRGEPPLGTVEGRAPAHLLHDPPGRLVGGDVAGYGAGAHVEGERPARALLDLGRVEPCAHARSGGDRLPDLLGSAGDVDLQGEHAIAHEGSLGRGWAASSSVNAARSAAERNRISASMPRVARRFSCFSAVLASSPTSRTTRAARAIR